MPFTQRQRWLLKPGDYIRHLDTLRNKDAELYIPSKVKKGKLVFAFKSLSNGNCLYSSVSLLLAGDNSLVQDLRLLTSIELYLNATYYTDELPYFTTVFSRYHGKITSSLMNLFMISLSHESIDEGSSNEQKVCNESIRNSKDQTYSSFICFLALSSVLGCVIVSLP